MIKMKQMDAACVICCTAVLLCMVRLVLTGSTPTTAECEAEGYNTDHSGFTSCLQRMLDVINIWCSSMQGMNIRHTHHEPIKLLLCECCATRCSRRRLISACQ